MTNVLDGWTVCVDLLSVLGPCGEKMVKRPMLMPGIPVSGRSPRFPREGV